MPFFFKKTKINNKINSKISNNSKDSKTTSKKTIILKNKGNIKL